MKFNFMLLTLLSFVFSLIKPAWAMECGGEREQEDENDRLTMHLGTVSKEERILDQVNVLESQGKLKKALVLILGAVHNDSTHTYNPFLGFRALLLYEQHPELAVSKEEKKEIGRKTADTFLNILKEKKVLGRFSDFHEDFFYMRIGKYLTQVYLILFGMEVDLEKLNLVKQKLSIGLEITEQIGHAQKTYLDCLIKFFTLLYKQLFSLGPLCSPDQGDAIDCYSKYLFYNELNTHYKLIAHKDFPGAMEEALECQRTISLHYLNKYIEGNFQKRFKPGVKWSMRYLAKEKTDKDKREGILTILRDCYEKRYEINVKNENELIFLTTLRPGISKGDGQYRFASFLEGVREEANRVNSLYQKAALGGSAGAQFKLYLLLKVNNDVFQQNTDGYLRADPFYWLNQAASRGDLKAQYEIYRIYEEGQGGDLELFKKENAEFWLWQSAFGGHAVAQYKLYLLLKESNDVFQQDTHDSLENDPFYWLNQAASRGDLKAQYEIYRIYEEGQGGDLELFKKENAEFWLRQAALGGYVEAQCKHSLLFTRALLNK